SVLSSVEAEFECGTGGLPSLERKRAGNAKFRTIRRAPSVFADNRDKRKSHAVPEKFAQTGSLPRILGIPLVRGRTRDDDSGSRPLDSMRCDTCRRPALNLRVGSPLRALRALPRPRVAIEDA